MNKSFKKKIIKRYINGKVWSLVVLRSRVKKQGRKTIGATEIKLLCSCGILGEENTNILKKDKEH